MTVPMTVPTSAEVCELVDDIAFNYSTKGDSVYSGAVELTADECKAILFNIVADAENFATRRIIWGDE